MGAQAKLKQNLLTCVPPGTPIERAQILQKALQETVKDNDFIAKADKAKIGLAPVTADDMRKTVEGHFQAGCRPGSQVKNDSVLTVEKMTP